MQSYHKILFLFVVLAACDEPTDLDLKQTPANVVIEGLVTNKPGYQMVKVTRTTDFYGSGRAPRVEDAVVTVTDDLGEEFVFMHNPRSHPDSAGIYLPAQSFTGVIGRTYTLQVEADGTRYTASDILHPVIPIDSLGIRINEDQQEDPNEPGKVYELLLFAREPQDADNYYLFKYYRNDSLVVYNPTDIYYSDDSMLGEEINGVPSPVYYGRDDAARLEVYSLTRNGYVFYNDLGTVLNSDGGGMFGPIPASPRTNLSNGALGFFQVSAIEEKQINIP